ncbi:hypothetical protein PRIPAC_79447, partial [Pristionchus pacificus]|uniref:Uncharacterized protein n=1 Tax=Pristionchus pacificus TaxID=54126 RepID=A0A2A6BH79_PRIPA
MYASRNVSEMTLSALPRDIIRIILRAKVQSMKSIRLISPSWNAIVLEHLSFRKNLPPLKAITLESPVQQFYTNKDLPVKVIVESDHCMPYQNNDSSHGIFPGWTTKESASEELHFESKYIHFCAPQRNTWIGDFVVIAFISCVLQYYHLNFQIILTIFFILIIILTLYTSFTRNSFQRGVELNCRKLNLILSQCSAIQILAMYDVEQSVVNIVREMIGSISINSMLLANMEFNENMRYLSQGSGENLQQRRLSATLPAANGLLGQQLPPSTRTYQHSQIGATPAVSQGARSAPSRVPQPPSLPPHPRMITCLVGGPLAVWQHGCSTMVLCAESRMSPSK